MFTRDPDRIDYRIDTFQARAPRFRSEIAQVVDDHRIACQYAGSTMYRRDDSMPCCQKRGGQMLADEAAGSGKKYNHA